MVERDHSFETIGEAERLAPADDGGEQVYDDDDEEEETDDGDGGNCGEDEVNGEQRRQLSELHSSPLIEAELDGSQSRTLPVASSSLQLREFTASSHLLSEVPVNYAILRPLEPADSKQAEIGVSHHNALAGEKTLAAVDQSQKLLSPGHPTSSSELSPISLLHSVPLASTPDSTKTLSVASVAKTPSIDGYNWRKYGQKQVKSPQGSRSYYRCTYSDCSAKKIECCDHSNHVVEIISKGLHNHDPPRRTNYSRGSRLALSAAPDSTSHSVRLPNDIDSSTSPKGFVQEFPALPETKRESSSGSDGTAEIEFKEEHVDEPEPKQRMKKSKSAYSESLSKPSKKPKFVVHAAGDVGISGDGYRWRKYGQKMVKGNPHPRNYYRCTSAGCPVRKHVERAVDNTSAVIITYKGVHDHDMPVPKKRHGPPSGHLVAAAAPSSMNNLPIRKTETIQNQFSATQWSVDRDGELTSETLDVAEDKAMESARTLLSIGFEIKQC